MRSVFALIGLLALAACSAEEEGHCFATAFWSRDGDSGNGQECWGAVEPACRSNETTCSWQDLSVAEAARRHFVFNHPDSPVREETVLEVNLTQGSDLILIAVGFCAGQVTLVRANSETDKVIIIDTTESPTCAARTRVALEAHIGPFQVDALVLTHAHPNHIYGVEAFLDEDTVLVRQEHFLDELNADGELVQYTGDRKYYMWGSLLPDDAPEFPYGWISNGGTLRLDPDHPKANSAQGLQERKDQTDRRKQEQRKMASEISEFFQNLPNDIIEVPDAPGSLNITLAGVRMEFYHLPSESDYMTIVYMPEFSAIMSADAFYPAFPNIYSLRGTKMRDIRDWMNANYFMAALEADVLVPGHAWPMYGKEKIASLFNTYGDGMHFIFEYTTEGMRKGIDVFELVENVQLPEELQGLEWLEDHYGTARLAVRQIYNFLLGFFSGDPADIDPLTRRSFVKEFLGVDNEGNADPYLLDGLMASLNSAHRRNTKASHRYSLEMTSGLLQLGYDDEGLRLMHRNSLRVLGVESLSSNNRNYYLSEAIIMEGIGTEP